MMSKLKKCLMIIIVLLVAINTLYGCTIDLFDMEGFENKEQIINAVKENIEDLNELTIKIYNKFKDNDRSYVYIENKLFKDGICYEYKTALSNKLFNKLKIRTVGIYYDEKRVLYYVKHKFGYDVGFYYSFSNNNYYFGYAKEDISKSEKYYYNLRYGNKTA